MPETSKYIAAPIKMIPSDTYGNPTSDVFETKLSEALTAVGATYIKPSADDVDNGNANILDYCDHQFFWGNPITNGIIENLDATFNAVEGHINNFQPRQRYSSGHAFPENIGVNTDLPPAVTPPAWYQGGSIDAWNQVGIETYLQWVFTLQPSTAYTLSFYVKKLGAVEWGTTLNFGAGTINSTIATSRDLDNGTGDFSPASAPLGTWQRVQLNFTTPVSGIVWITLGGYSTWAAGNKTQGLRLCFPQLEKNAVNTAWTTSRYWKYYPLPTPINIINTLADGSIGRQLVGTTIGSSRWMRLDIRSDYGLCAGTIRYRQTGKPTPLGNYTSSEATYNRPNITSRHDPFLASSFAWSHAQLVATGLNGFVCSLTGYASTSATIAVDVRGMWVRQLNDGGQIVANSNGLSGLGHNKRINLRLTDLGSNNFRLKMGNANCGMQPSAVCDASWVAMDYRSLDPLVDRTVANFGFFLTGLCAVQSIDLLKNSDIFLDTIGNIQGFAINMFQGIGYSQFFGFVDFLDPPVVGDDGTNLPRWGMILPNNAVGYVAVGYCSEYAESWLGGNSKGFMSGQGLSDNPLSTAAPTAFQEIALGNANTTRTGVQQAYATRAETISSARGKMVNFYFSTSASFAGLVGDKWESVDGQRFYCLFKQSTSQETINLYIKP